MESVSYLKSIYDVIDELVNNLTKVRNFVTESNEIILIPHKDLFEETNAITELFDSMIKNLERQKIVADAPKVLVLYGQFSTGKTTLVNALLRRCYSTGSGLFELPTADDPTTAKPVRIRCNPDQHSDIEASVIQQNGEEESVSVDFAVQLCRSDTDHEEVIFSCKHIALGPFEILDIPGTGAAFFDKHDKIVKNRLRDAAAVIWLAGGVDNAFPNRDEMDLLRRTAIESGRPVIPVWNGFQDLDVIIRCGVDNIDREEAKKQSIEFHDYCRDLGLTGPTIVYPLEAIAFSDDEHTSAAGIISLRDSIEAEIAAAQSGEKIAAENIEGIQKEAINTLRRFTGVLYDMLDRQKGLRSDVIRAGRLIDETEYDCRDIVRVISTASAEEITHDMIIPAIRDFVDTTTSPGGGIAVFIKAVTKNPLKVKKIMQEELKSKIETALDLDSSDGSLVTFIRQSIEDARIKINRKVSTLIANLSAIVQDILELHSISFEKLRSQSLVDSLSASTTDKITDLIGNMALLIAGALTTILLIIWPKTGTVADVFIAIGGLIALPGLLSLLRRRMHGQVDASAKLFSIEIRKTIRKPLTGYLDTIFTRIHVIIKLERVSEVVGDIEKAIEKARGFLAELTGIF